MKKKTKKNRGISNYYLLSKYSALIAAIFAVPAFILIVLRNTFEHPAYTYLFFLFLLIEFLLFSFVRIGYTVFSKERRMPQYITTLIVLTIFFALGVLIVGTISEFLKIPTIILPVVDTVVSILSIAIFAYFYSFSDKFKKLKYLSIVGILNFSFAIIVSWLPASQVQNRLILFLGLVVTPFVFLLPLILSILEFSFFKEISVSRKNKKV